jgi:hypothetical protein
MNRRSSASRSRLLVACAHRIGVVPRLRSPDRPSVPFSNNALPSPGNPPPPTEVEDDLRWTRARRPSRIASHDRRRSPLAVSDRWASVECPTSGPCSADESVTFPGHFRPDNALSFHGLCSPPRSSVARRLDDLDACLAPEGALHSTETRMSQRLAPDLSACRRSIPPSIHRCHE